VGKQVKVEVMGENNANLTATITAIEPQIIASSRNIKVRASIKGKVFPGAYAKIYLGANTAKQIIMVPQNVIIPESKNKQIVIVKNGTAKFVSVKTGYRTSSSVEITEGLKVGDSVIVAGMLFVKEGSKLKIGKTFKSAEINK
jgi:membrane fusion protein (multidrug efflux system)